jgi:Flp pilus assembly protein TadG
MVEFALVAPVFFFTIFAMIDGGFLLFSVNAVDQATTVGTNSIAALGKLATADTTALQRMVQSPGVETTKLVNISEVDVEELATNSTGDGFQTDGTGAPIIATTGCSGSCVNKYMLGAGGAITSSTVAWPPSARDVYNGESSFVGLKVTYSYRFFTGIAPVLNLTTTKTFRLEPQNAPGT